MNIKRLTAILSTSVSLLVLLSNQALAVSFDYPGGFFTSGVAINASGAITGNYFDAGGGQHGFLRNPDGTFVGFDVSGATATDPAVINDAGTIAGRFTNPDHSTGGFVRDPSGLITTFNVGANLVVFGINSSGVIVGTTHQGSTTECFLRDGLGALTTFTVLGSNNSNCTAINNAGTVAGWFGSGQGFVLAAGVVTTFAVQSLRTLPAGMNNSGVITGNYVLPSQLNSGFVRSADGTVTPFVIPAATDIFPRKINLGGTVVGFSFDSKRVVHAFARTPDGRSIQLDPAGAIFAQANGINDSGTATGFWVDANQLGHAFVTTTSCAAPSIDSLTASPNTLSPNNNKLVPVTISVVTGGGCGSVTCQIISVTSNEAISQGVDWAITGPLTLNLRASRDGSGQGRTYTVTVLCTDGSGNKTSSTVTVFVPHDRR